MALEDDITEDDKIFLDTDLVLPFRVWAGNPTAAEIAANTAVPVDVSGWAMSWTLRRTVDASSALIEKATGGNGIIVSGAFNVDPTLNEQQVEVTIEDTDTYDASADPPVDVRPSKSYRYALKRTDDGSETVLVFGKFCLLKSAARE